MRFLLALLFTLPAHAFLLIQPDYKLKFDKEVKVYISSEGCGGNGISDGELEDAIKKVIKDYWNTVPESRLVMKFAGKSSESVASGPPSKGIIVGCATLGAGIGGDQLQSKEKGSSVVRMSDSLTAADSQFIGILGHEIGHSVGLGHSKDKASIMTYESNGWGEKPKYLSQDDKNGVVYLYPNEKKVMGLVPSCDSFAADGSEQTPASSNFFFTLLCGVLVVGLFARRIK